MRKHPFLHYLPQPGQKTQQESHPQGERKKDNGGKGNRKNRMRIQKGQIRTVKEFDE